MSGRGDNNKKGTSGQGGSNQSGQGIPSEAGKVNHGKEQTGTQPSEPMSDQKDQSAHRDRSTDGDRRQP